MRKQFMTTDDDWVIVVGVHLILFVLLVIGKAMV